MNINFEQFLNDFDIIFLTVIVISVFFVLSIFQVPENWISGVSGSSALTNPTKPTERNAFKLNKIFPPLERLSPAVERSEGISVS